MLRNEIHSYFRNFVSLIRTFVDLLLNLQFAHQFVVGLCVFALQIFHEAAAFSYFFDQTASRRKVFLMSAKVLGEIPYFLR